MVLIQSSANFYSCIHNQLYCKDEKKIEAGNDPFKNLQVLVIPYLSSCLFTLQDTIKLDNILLCSFMFWRKHFLLPKQPSLLCNMLCVNEPLSLIETCISPNKVKHSGIENLANQPKHNTTAFYAALLGTTLTTLSWAFILTKLPQTNPPQGLKLN